MIPIMGVPFLERALQRIKSAGIDHVILASGYLPEAISAHFGDGSQLGLRLTYVIEESPMGTAGAIKNVESYIEGPFFVFNGDVMTSLDLRAMITFHRERGGIGALHVIKVEDPSPFGAVVHDESGLVSRFVEKPPKETAPSNDINAGTYLLEPEILDFIPEGRAVSIERETFPAAISSGSKLYAYLTTDYWIDIGRPDQYRDAHHQVFDGTMPIGVDFSRGGIGGAGADQPAGTLVAPVYLGKGVVVEAGARVGPYTVLGDGTRVARGARVVDSLLWDGVIVGPEAIVEEAIVASRARIGARARVARGSVLGHDVVVEEGTSVPEGSRVVAEGVATA